MSASDETPRAAWLPIPGGDELPAEVDETSRPIADKHEGRVGRA